jgi:hypothetical protein
MWHIVNYLRALASRKSPDTAPQIEPQNLKPNAFDQP